MAKDPSYPMYAQDFDMDTASWSNAEVGGFTRLINYEWINGPLPNSIPALARIARCDVRTFTKMWESEIGKKFTVNDANMLINRRMEEERAKRVKYLEIQREKGKSGADKRWRNPMAGGIAGAMPEPSPGHKPEDGSSSSSSLKDNTLVGSGTPDATEDIPIPGKNDCPHEKIIDIYHEILPMLPRVRQWTPKRQKHLKARWVSSMEYQDLEWWSRFFRYIADCPHLIGKNDRQWTANLEWICQESNFVKILEGNYEKR